MMKEEFGEVEVHTTELTALSAADSNNVIMEVHTTDSNNANLTTDSNIIIVEAHATDSNINMEDEFTQQQQQQQRQRQQQQQQQRQQQQHPVFLPPFFKAMDGPSMEQQQQQQHRLPFFTAVAVPAAASTPAVAADGPSSFSFSSTYSLFPPASSSSSSSLDFTAAWVASTPFSAAAAATPLSSSISSSSGFPVNGAGCGSGVNGAGCGSGVVGGCGDRSLHFLTPKVVTTASAMSTASMLATSTSFGKPRSLSATALQLQQQQHQTQQQQPPPPQPQFQRQVNKNGACDQQTSALAPNPAASHFVTPQFVAAPSSLGGGVFRFPKDESNGGGGDAVAAAPPFFVPTVGVIGDAYDKGQFKYPLYNRNMATNHLGRHWKQMGCHTRQYLQPSIPLPTASTRMASAAAKQLRGASLGGPPGSLSPLAASKSWAQVVASSTPQQSKQIQQQQQRQTSFGEGANHCGDNDQRQKQQQQQQQRPTNKPAMPPPAALPPPPPPPVFVVGVVGGGGGGGGGVSKSSRSAPLRGLAGLGVSTSSNRDFKSLLLRLKTALDKEKEKWRPRGPGGGGGGGGGAAAAAVTENEAASAATASSATIETTPEGLLYIVQQAAPNNNKNAVVKRAASSSSATIISGQQRDECIYWLAWILRKFRFSAETMSLAVALFDAVLMSSSSSAASPGGVSTPPPLLTVTSENCKLVALVCMLLAAKFSEEDADVPTTKDLLAVSEIGVDGAGAAGNNSNDAGGCRVSLEAALKMERVILTSLDWDLNLATPLKFLEILHTLLMCHQPQLLEDVALGLTPAKHLERLTWKMQRIVANHQLALCFRPAILAVALLSVDLESIGVSDWQLVSATLEKICHIGSGSGGHGGGGENRHKLARCKNLIIRLLAGDRKGATSSSSSPSKNNDNAGGTVATAARPFGRASGGGGGGGGGGRAAAGGGGGGGGGSGGFRKVVSSEIWSSADLEKKRSMTKLKRKHVPSECGVGGGGGAGNMDAAVATASSTTDAAVAASTTTTTSSSCSSTASSSSKSTLKRVFNIAESPTCKSEARSEEEAARGGVAAADRFQALQGLCINIY